MRAYQGLDKPFRNTTLVNDRVKTESPHKYFPILQENDIYHGDITNVLAINNNGRHNPSEEKLYLIAEDRIKMFEKLDSQK